MSGTAAPIPVPRDLCSRSASARGASGARCEPTPADAAPCRAGNGADFHATESSAARDVQLCIHLPRYNAPRWSARPSRQPRSLRVCVLAAPARSRDWWDAPAILQSLLSTPFPVFPLTPRTATGVPLGAALPEAGWRCARARWGPGMDPPAVQVAAGAAPLVAGSSTAKSGVEEQLWGTVKAANRSSVRAGGSGAPELGPALHCSPVRRGWRACRCRCRRPPAPRLLQPSLLPGNLLARLGQAKQTAIPGAISPGGML